MQGQRIAGSGLLDELADVCGDEDIWLHVDGAYGAAAILSEKEGSY